MERVRVVVGVDFGTTFSGFAFAHMEDTTKVNNFVDWPETSSAGAPVYCKTQTSLYYKYCDDGEYTLSYWGWPAQVAHAEAVKAATKAAKNGQTVPLADKFLTKFKLLLAGADNLGNSGHQKAADALPHGLTVERVITDYLREMKIFIMNLLQTKYGGSLGITAVQWCLTVPAIWTDDAKIVMKICSQKAGLVEGHHTPPGDPASPHPIVIVLEPEAAAMACWKEPGDHVDIDEGEHILVADVGGGTVDIVVHERRRRNDRRLKEVAPSSGGLFGGSFVDEAFVNLLRTRIPCFQEYLTVRGGAWWTTILRNWHNFKSTYDGGERSRLGVDLPESLSSAWRKYDRDHDIKKDDDDDYDELQLTNADLKSVFDPTVNGIMRLIHEKMSPRVKVLMVVGGFSASPYLMARIKAELGPSLRSIVNPNDPGAAICRGAVEWALHPDSRIVSRIAKKSYGVGVYKPFQENVHPRERRIKDHKKNYVCKGLWDVYVTKGQEVEVDSTKAEEYGLHDPKDKTICIRVYSTSVEPEPMFIDDARVALVGSFEMDVSCSGGRKAARDRKVAVTMQFGQATIEVQGRRVNFGDTTKVDTFKFVFDAASNGD